jgi:hypothetical protein
MLTAWIDANDYCIVDSAREIYHYCQGLLRRDDDSYVTEIQMPMEKVSCG